MRHLYLCSALLACAAGCSDDPVSVSDVVDLKLALASGDVDNGVLFDEKNVNTESGNPYGVFVSMAREEIGGEPSRITVDGTTVTVDATSTNVTMLGGVFLGATKVEFIMNGSTTKYAVATRDVVAADVAGPVEFGVDFDSDKIPAEDFSDLASGSFKVAISGPAAATFEAANADADLTVSLTFSAFE
ncbi:MAG TPA: hypothetical protein VIV11_29325 [Kofleriaceae bacterium]